MAALLQTADSGTLALGFALECALPRRRIWALPLDPGQLRHELIGNLVFLAITIASFTLALASRATRFGDDSLLSAAATFAALALGFQLFYYGLHRAMHRRSLVRFHRWHHVSRVTTPLSGQSMSAVEALGWMVGYVGLPVALSQLVPISAAGWTAYMAFNVFGNIVGHANVEAVPHTPLLRWTALLGNAFVYHALHHARWNGHYSFAAALMDRLFGSEWPDWLELNARVGAGRPLTSLHERGGTGAAPASHA
jgi:sterol desaturase/sphingolipid hydroxylase (fatty acid hydroxylase superfamily)